MNISIIGGVAGGAGAAAAARRANESAAINLFEATPYISFANCGLPYYLSGEITPREKLLVTPPALLEGRLNIRVHTRHLVLAIDRTAKTLRIRNLETNTEFTHPYDRLIIATGAKAIRPPTPGLDHPRISECRTIDDIDRLAALARHSAAKPAPLGGRSEAKPPRALVIGAGFIGLEVAEALSLRNCHVTILDLASQVLPPLDPEIASAAQAELVKHGITLHLGTQVTHFNHTDSHSTALLANGQSVDFDFAVLGIGVTPDTSLAKEAGLALGPTGGLVVNDHQQASDPAIYAAGDVTELLFWPTGARQRLALAGPANKQARVAGANAAAPEPAALGGRSAAKPPSTSGAAGTSIVRVFDLALGSTGLSEKLARKLNLPHQVVYTQNAHHASYFPGAQPLFIKLLFNPTDGRVLGGQIFGPQGVDKRLDVLATALQARFTVDQLADLDLAYAPPFGSAKDPLIIAAMVASNAYHHRTRLITPQQLAAELASSAAPFVLDVRSPKEYALAHISNAVNLPLESLRATHTQLPKDRPIVIHCAVGYRGYLAERLLSQLGHKSLRNLTGGFRAWQLTHPT